MSGLIISCDPGIKGGICIINRVDVSVYPIPTITKIRKRKQKSTGKMVDAKYKVYDLKALYDLLVGYEKFDAVFVIETVHSMPGEGSVSVFGFARGFGQLEGIAVGMGFMSQGVLPNTWKSHYKALITDEILALKEEQKVIRQVIKNVKDVSNKKQKKKDIEKIARRIKSLGKKQSRKLAAEMCPEISEQLKPESSDGLAEAYLIGKYIQDRGRSI